MDKQVSPDPAVIDSVVDYYFDEWAGLPIEDLFDIRNYFVQFTNPNHTLKLFGDRIPLRIVWSNGKRFIVPIRYYGRLTKQGKKYYAQNCFLDDETHIRILEKGPQIFDTIANEEYVSIHRLRVWHVSVQRYSGKRDKKLVKYHMSQGKTLFLYSPYQEILMTKDFYAREAFPIEERGPFPLADIYCDEDRNARIFERHCSHLIKK